MTIYKEYLMDIKEIKSHKDFVERRPIYDEMYNALEEVLESYDGHIFPHEKVAALDILKTLIIYSECVDMVDA